MTKIHKTRKRRKVIKLSASFLIALFVFASCKKDISTIGTNINPNGLNIVVQDTFTVLTKTVAVDSLRTDETINNLLGAVNDPELGKVDCGIVTQLRLSSEAPDFGDINLITVDSVVLSFVYNDRLHYGDLTDLTFEVYQITDNLEKDASYYRQTDINTNTENLVVPGTETQRPRPESSTFLADDTLVPMLRINLLTSFGDFLIQNANQLASNETFTDFFKGLYIKSTSASSFAANKGTVLYFNLLDLLSNMVLYYDLDNEKKKFTFTINNSCARFNKIDFDFEGTPLEQSLNSQIAAQEKIYFQGSHIRPEFKFPHLPDFTKSANIILNKAELVVPVQNYKNSPFAPSSLLRVGRVISNFSTSTLVVTENIFDAQENAFRFNLTRELQQIVSGESENTWYRLYAIPFFGSSIERIIFSGPNSITKDKTKLVLTYTEY